MILVVNDRDYYDGGSFWPLTKAFLLHFRTMLVFNLISATKPFPGISNVPFETYLY